MRRDEDIAIGRNLRPDLALVVGQYALGGILQALATWRRNIKAAPPSMHLLLAPAFARLILVEPGKIAVVALVEPLIAAHRQSRLPEFREHDVKGTLCTFERTGKG